MKKSILIISFISLFVTFTACNSQKIDVTNDSLALTKEQQQKLTPDMVIDGLKKGNDDYVNGKLTVRNNMKRIQSAISGQYPEAIVLSCIDSRVPVEDIFHRGLGDLFVARVAGNTIDEYMLASMEYACKVSASKVVVVLGHSDCGALKSAIKGVELGNITALLDKMEPAISEAKKDYSGEVSAYNKEFLNLVCEHNIEHVLKEIRENSLILKEMEKNGEIKIVGAVYNLDSGKVEFID